MSASERCQILKYLLCTPSIKNYLKRHYLLDKFHTAPKGSVCRLAPNLKITGYLTYNYYNTEKYVWMVKDRSGSLDRSTTDTKRLFHLPKSLSGVLAFTASPLQTCSSWAKPEKSFLSLFSILWGGAFLVSPRVSRVVQVSLG